MTFIPLNRNNFVKNKIKGVVNTEYDKKDSSTFIYSSEVDTKSLMFNKNDYSTKIKFEDLGLDINNTNHVNGFNKLIFFLNTISTQSQNSFQNIDLNYINNKKLEIKNLLGLSESDFLNFFKDSKFKNEFHIEKFKPRFILGDNFLQKKSILKKSFYNDLYDNEFLKNKHFGFCNYNTLNFISTERTGKVHNNCFVYPNDKIAENKNTYDFINRDIFYFQTRLITRNVSLLDTPRCIIHVPGVINLYLVKSKNDSKARVCITTSELTKENINDLSSQELFNTSFERAQSKEKLLLTESYFDENKWYTLGVKFNKNRNNVEIYIDGVLKDAFDIILNIEESNIDSYICVGNKPNYFNKLKQGFIQSYNNNFYFYFNRTTFLEKDIKINNSNDIDLRSVSLQNIFDNNEYAIFDSQSSKNEGFLGELSDIRFYSCNITEAEVLYLHNNFIEDIYDEFNLNNLSFYVPLFYIPDSISKKGLLTAEGKEDDISYDNFFNPFFYSYGGGLEISLENYVIELARFVKPNIVLNGSVHESIHYEKTGEGLSLVLNNNREEVSRRFGNGESINDIYNDLYYRDYIENFDPSNDSLSDIYSGNLIIKNNFILPNDNGIPNIDFGLIEKVINKNQVKVDSTFKSHGENLYFHLNCDNIINNKEYFIPENIDYLRQRRIHNFPYNINNDIKTPYEFTNDPLLDLSNIIYFSVNIDNVSDFFLNSNFNDSIVQKLDRVKSYINGSYCNPCYRDIFNSFKGIRNGNIFTSKEGFNTSVDYYQRENIIGDFFKDYDNYFSSIINIPAKFYNNQVKKESLILRDKNISKLGISLTLKDDGFGSVYRADCLTKTADWNYVGHVFYSKGLVLINNVTLYNFLDNELHATFGSNAIMHVQEINIPIDIDEHNLSQNLSYDSELRKNDSSVNAEDRFVYITDVNLHDEHFNIIAKSKIARPIAKSDHDRFLIRLKMDY